MLSKNFKRKIFKKKSYKEKKFNKKFHILIFSEFFSEISSSQISNYIFYLVNVLFGLCKSVYNVLLYGPVWMYVSKMTAYSMWLYAIVCKYVCV